MNALTGEGLRHGYRRDGVETPVLDGVDLTVAPGEAVALLGRSGAGKSTLLRLLLALERPGGGRVRLGERVVEPGSVRALAWFRRRVQYVPQEPAGSLDPRATVHQLVRDPLRRLGVPGDHEERVADALAGVGLGPDLLRRRVHEISGGQAQRVAIARAVATGAEILLADEPVSGLDLPLRRQVLELLERLRRERGIGVLLVSHDLDAVARLCTRSLVLADRVVVEQGPTEELLAAPRSSALRQLVAALPRLAEARVLR